MSTGLEVTESVKQKNILYIFCLKITLFQFKSELSNVYHQTTTNHEFVVFITKGIKYVHRQHVCPPVSPSVSIQ